MLVRRSDAPPARPSTAGLFGYLDLLTRAQRQLIPARVPGELVHYAAPHRLASRPPPARQPTR
jgi:hypothetical protein